MAAGLSEEDEVTSDQPGSLLGATEQMLRVEHRERYDSNLLLVLATQQWDKDGVKRSPNPPPHRTLTFIHISIKLTTLQRCHVCRSVK